MLEHNLRFHHALGVDHFIVTDNGSTDETVDILARYAEAGLMTVIEAPNTDYREQGAKWMTDMARLAATELEADWVVHTDADEFWWPIEGSLSGDARRGPRPLRGPDGPAVRVHRPARRPRLVRRAADDPRGPVPLPAQGGAPRRPGRRLDRQGTPRRRRGWSLRGRDRDDSPARPAGAPRDPQPGARGERRGPTTTRGWCGRRGGRCGSSTSRSAPRRSSSGAPRSRSSRACSPTGGGSSACVSTTRKVASTSSTVS